MAAPEHAHHPIRYGIRLQWLLTASATALALIGFSSSAHAACDPAAADNVTANCTGTTDNQGTGAPGTSTDPNGYGYGSGVENLIVTVAPGANVTGNFLGIFANALTLTNSGTIFGFSGAVEAATANITNSGLIRGGSHTIIVANTATVINSGTISGDAGHAIEAGTASVTNSGNISAVAQGITATGTADVTNSGTISADIGIASQTSAIVANSGTISTQKYGVIGIVATVTNSGTISAINDASSVAIGGATEATVINSGTITSTGAGVYTGINFAAPNGHTTVTNSGTISGGSHGVYDMFGNLNVINSGTISGGDFGILAGSNLVVTNFGTITGKLGIGVTLFGSVGANVTNAGTIIGTDGTAVQFFPSNSVFVMSGPNAKLVGQAIGSGTDTFRFAGTGSNSFDIAQMGPGWTLLDKTGSSNWSLAGTLAYTGPITVNGGTLSLNGDFTSASGVTVNAGGALGGNGIVGNTVIDGGALAPGNSIGTLTIAGNLVMTAASTYMVQVSGAQADKAIVTGTADIAGKVLVDPVGRVTRTTTYTIMAAGTRSGTFSDVSFLTPTNLARNPRLAHVGNDVLLTLDAGLLSPFLPSNASVNQRNVAAGMDNALLGGAALPGGFEALFNLSGDPLLKALSLASGEIATSASQAAFDAQSQFLNTLTDPFAGGYRGNASVAGSSPHALGYAATANEGRPRDAFASLVTKAPPMVSDFDQRWRTFGAVYGGSSQIGGNAVLGSHDATSRVYGAMGGASYALLPATQVGFAFGGGGTSFALAGGMGSGHSDMFQAGVFAHHSLARNGYLSGAFAFGWHDVTTDRTVATGERLRGSYEAGVLSGRLEAGWRIDTAWAGVTPYAATQAISYRMPSYLEQGNGTADSFGLSYAGRDVTATRSELGLRLDRTTVLGEAVFTLRGRAAWAHNFDTARNAAATFQALPGSGFLVNGAAMAGDAALVTAGAEIAWRNGFALAASFEGEFSNNVESYAGKGTLRYAW